MAADTTVGELVVDALLWRRAGPHTPPPASMADMAAAEQQAMYDRADRLARANGEEYADAVTATVADHVRRSRQ